MVVTQVLEELYHKAVAVVELIQVLMEEMADQVEEVLMQVVVVEKDQVTHLLQLPHKVNLEVIKTLVMEVK